MKVKLSIINDEFTHGYQYDLKDPLEKEWGKESRKDLAIFMNYCINNYDNDKKYKLIDVENVDDVIEKFFDYVVNDKFEFFIRLRSDQITDIIKNFGSDLLAAKIFSGEIDADNLLKEEFKNKI